MDIVLAVVTTTFAVLVLIAVGAYTLMLVHEAWDFLSRKW